MPKKLRIIKTKKVSKEEPLQEVQPETITKNESPDAFTIEGMNERVEDLEDSDSDDIDFDQEVKKLLGIRQASQTPQYFATRKIVDKKEEFILENSSVFTNTMTRVPTGIITSNPVGTRPSKVSNRC